MAFDLPIARVSRWVPPAPGNGAEIDFGLTELGVVGGDDDVAHHGKLAAAAERMAGNRGDDRLFEFGNALPGTDEIALLRVHVVLLLHLRDVSTRGKHPIRAGQHDRGDIGIGIESLERLIEFVDDLPIQRIDLRTVQGDHPDWIAAVDQKGLICHDFSPLPGVPAMCRFPIRSPKRSRNKHQERPRRLA